MNTPKKPSIASGSGPVDRSRASRCGVGSDLVRVSARGVDRKVAGQTPCRHSNDMVRITRLLFEGRTSAWCGSRFRGSERKAGGCSESRRGFCNRLAGRRRRVVRKPTRRSFSRSVEVRLKRRARCARNVRYASSASSTRSRTKSSSAFGEERLSASAVGSAKSVLVEACAQLLDAQDKTSRLRTPTPPRVSARLNQELMLAPCSVIMPNYVECAVVHSRS
jgi:hypothetical protein